MKKFYVTTAIAYVNAAPHVGFAMEVILADALARYHRLKGEDVFYLTGVDEHGVKLYETAKEASMDVQKFADLNAKKFEDLKGVLNLSNDDFIRTTSAKHKSGAQKIWMKMVEAGDIYKSSYNGNYCVGCEAFIPDKDLDENGNCPIHKKKPKVLEEENYFFKLSKYSDRIKEAISSDELKIYPESRKHEILNLIGEGGLKDVSFSRPKDVLPWGIDVPNDKSQVMYVWCDALSNYITAIGYEDEGKDFKKFWPADVHIIGKDILRFHAGVWIGMLFSAEIPLPKSICVHGFITSEGVKMSKSLGNVVDPLLYVEKYGVDPLRYYLLREIPTTDDGDFSQSRFENLYNSELANGLGNLLNRVVMMVERYLDGKVPKKSDGGEIKDKALGIVAKYEKFYEQFDVKSACEAVVELINLGNKYIDDEKPWALAPQSGEGSSKLDDVLDNLLEILKFIGILIYPILPSTGEKILESLGLAKKNLKFENKWGTIKTGTSVKKCDVLFPRLEG